ncbi:MAG: prepilin-type N-terminal cleavage/methylation domain-containing protein [Verrucomicrobiota bacterium]
MKSSSYQSGFTLLELLVVLVVLVSLITLASPAIQRSLRAGQAGASMSNLRQLVTANLAYAADNDGRFSPAQSPDNLIRWHGARASGSSAFDPTKGFLSPYLGKSNRVSTCPLFKDHISDGSSWELGTGGYGYNAIYIGGTYNNNFTPERAVNISNPTQTVMFSTTAFAKSDGLQEYPYSEPFRWVDPNGNLAGPLQPSTHFRANGKAIIAWCDGHVTQERPNSESGPNYYGGDNRDSEIGWFGPSTNNGFWNPKQSFGP